VLAYFDFLGNMCLFVDVDSFFHHRNANHIVVTSTCSPGCNGLSAAWRVTVTSS
jgi:hypothetical protein